jgi:3-phosphoshikimate 1-carboxyvinyltransferase
MIDSIEIEPVSGSLCGRIRPPGSKSITNRALLVAALAEGTTVLHGALASEDTDVMINSLQQLGIEVQVDSASSQIMIEGCAGQIPITQAELNLANSGTSIRFLTAVLGILGGHYCLDGIPRMRERPIGPLIGALNVLGAHAVALSPGNCPPVRLNSSRIPGGSVKISGDLSSQYLSGLLMAAPFASRGLTIEVQGDLVSQSYVNMTLKMMSDFGVHCAADEELKRFEIRPGQCYRGREYRIEPDASAASYFWAAAAICGGSGTVEGLNAHSLQGDIQFVRVLESMGCQVSMEENQITVQGAAKHGIEVDMNDISDTVQTLAAVAVFLNGATTIRNIAHNRVKETDRIHFLAVELRKLGVEVDEFPDGLTITPKPLHAATFETYQDHRMAMSLSLLGLRLPGVRILNPNCVAKTYPNYFRDLKEFCRPQ